MASQLPGKSALVEGVVPRKPVRGRSGVADRLPDVSPTKRRTEVEHKTQANRPVSAGAGPRRGDRRDMHPKFSTGKTNSAGGKKGPTGRSTRKGGRNSDS